MRTCAEISWEPSADPDRVRIWPPVGELLIGDTLAISADFTGSENRKRSARKKLKRNAESPHRSPIKHLSASSSPLLSRPHSLSIFASSRSDGPCLTTSSSELLHADAPFSDVKSSVFCKNGLLTILVCKTKKTTSSVLNLYHESLMRALLDLLIGTGLKNDHLGCKNGQKCQFGKRRFQDLRLCLFQNPHLYEDFAPQIPEEATTMPCYARSFEDEDNPDVLMAPHELVTGAQVRLLPRLPLPALFSNSGVSILFFLTAREGAQVKMGPRQSTPAPVHQGHLQEGLHLVRAHRPADHTLNLRIDPGIVQQREFRALFPTFKETHGRAPATTLSRSMCIKPKAGGVIFVDFLSNFLTS